MLYLVQTGVRSQMGGLTPSEVADITAEEVSIYNTTHTLLIAY
jgi:hypothetical protein